MPGSFWIIFGLVVLLCGYLFKKTVSNDAQNDVKLRDILSNSSNIKSESTCEEYPENSVISEYENTESIKSVTVEEKSTVQSTPEYATTIHNNTYYQSTGNNLSQETSVKSVSEESYYQKDRCMVTGKVEEPQEEQEPQENKKIYKSVPEVSLEQDYYPLKKEQVMTVEKKGLLYYTKIFWKGATFAMGIPACLFGLYSFLYCSPTATDKLVASVWVLIGVLLLK